MALASDLFVTHLLISATYFSDLKIRGKDAQRRRPLPDKGVEFTLITDRFLCKNNEREDCMLINTGEEVMTHRAAKPKNGEAIGSARGIHKVIDVFLE